MMDERSGETSRSLYGHAGTVNSVSFSPDRSLLLSCSEDTTIRLWSLQIWTCLVVYKGHMFPVWDVKFSPLGYYFASTSYDRTARLWATDHYQPLRLFAGHFSDVDVSPPTTTPQPYNDRPCSVSSSTPIRTTWPPDPATDASACGTAPQGTTSG
jgi:WD40 repeat protein